jgi:hypothetical protein
LFYIDDIKAQLLEGKDNIFGTGVHRKVSDNCLDRLIGFWVRGEVVEFAIVKIIRHGVIFCHAVGNYVDPGSRGPERKLIL